MRACGICGVTALYNFQYYFQYIDNKYCGESPKAKCIRYGVANYIMLEHRTNSSGQKINVCNRCQSKEDQEKENVYVVMHSPEYIASILKVHPLKVQLLSFLDISLWLEENKFDFASGQIEDCSLLNSPLVCSDGIMDEKEFWEGLVEDLQPIVEANNCNPWFKKYVTNFESPNNISTSVYVLS